MTFLKASSLALAFSLWLLAAYILLGRYVLPGMDNWCYFAPGMAATRPFELHMPLLGDFHGADKTWGIHWPGALWFYSLFGWLIGEHFGLHPLLFLSLIIGLAVLTLRLGRSMGLEGVWAWAPVAGVMVDRGLINTAAQQRPELVTACWLVGWILAIGEPKQTRLRLCAIGVCAAMLGLCHPITMVVMVGTLPVAALFAWRKPGTRAMIASHALGVIAGVALFGGRLWLNPAARDQFQNHASMAKGSLLNATPWVAAWIHFSPLPVGLIGLVVALVVMAGHLWKQRLELSITTASATSLALLGLVMAGHLFINDHYLRVTVPLILVLCCAAAQRFCGTSGRWAVIALIVVVAPSLLWWGYMLNTARRDGFPFVRQNLQAFYDQIPASARRVCLPDVLCQTGMLDHSRDVRFVTPPYSVTSDRRDQYERLTLPRLQSGDVVIVNPTAKDNQPRSHPWLDGNWPVIARSSWRFSTRAPWGYDLIMYQKP